MAIETNGRLYNLLQKCAPNAKVEVEVNGQLLAIGRVRYFNNKDTPLRVEIVTQAMSDAELFGDLDEQAENGLDSGDKDED